MGMQREEQIKPHGIGEQISSGVERAQTRQTPRSVLSVSSSCPNLLHAARAFTDAKADESERIGASIGRFHQFKGIQNRTPLPASASATTAGVGRHSARIARSPRES